MCWIELNTKVDRFIFDSGSCYVTLTILDSQCRLDWPQTSAGLLPPPPSAEIIVHTDHSAQCVQY